MSSSSSSSSSPAGAGPGFVLPPLPEVLFDGMTVLRALRPEAAKRTSADQVSDVLDAVVRLMRNEAGAGPDIPDSAAALLRNLRTQRDEADRCAGAALRELAGVKEELAALKRTRQHMKAQAGYGEHVSFDVVWAETLARARANSSSTGEGSA